MLFGRKNKNPIKIADKGVVEWKYATCGYCSTGCSIEVGLNATGKPVASRGVADADVNRGKLCLKGIFEHELFESAGRGHEPKIREHWHQPWQKTDWDTALDKTAAEIKRIQEKYGRDSFAIISTGQMLTEEFYTLGKLTRGLIGTNNYDGNTTLCMGRITMMAIQRYVWPRPCPVTNALLAPMARLDVMKTLNIQIV